MRSSISAWNWPPQAVRTLALVLLGAPVSGCVGSHPSDHAVLVTDTVLRPTGALRYSISIRGNDGATPGDVLEVGQSSRLVASTDSTRGVNAYEVAARLSWSSTAPRILSVDSVGRVRALATGTAVVHAAAYRPGGSTQTPFATAAMPFRVVPPAATASAPRFVSVRTAASSDAEQTCGVLDSGSIGCLLPVTGAGFLPDAEAALHLYPPPPGARFTAVAVGAWHVCALDGAGRAYCWGMNRLGALGHASDAEMPVPVATHARFRQVVAGRDHSCGLTSHGELLCWGLGMRLMLPLLPIDLCTLEFERHHSGGHEQVRPCGWKPRPVRMPAPVAEVVAGDSHLCALLTTGELYCWGSIYDIDLHTARPRRVETGGVRLVRIASGSRHVCGFDRLGVAYCWGRNWFGQSGRAAPHTGARVLTRVPGAPPLASISAGDEHTCGVTSDGTGFCWGRNFDGQLGGGPPLEDGFRRVSGTLKWREITAGFDHSCGVTTAGALYCWGSGLAFRASPGSLAEQPEPFAVIGWR